MILSPAAIMNSADLYTGMPYELHIENNAWWGDHWYFWQAGFDAVNHEESYDWDDPDFNPYYHTTQDLVDHIDPDFAYRDGIRRSLYQHGIGNGR